MTDLIPTWQSVRKPAPERLLIVETDAYLFMEWSTDNCPKQFRGFPTLKRGEPQHSLKREFSRSCGFIRASSLDKFAQLLGDQLIESEHQRNLHKGHHEHQADWLAGRLKLMDEAELSAWVATKLGLAMLRQQRQVERMIEIIADELNSE